MSTTAMISPADARIFSMFFFMMPPLGRRRPAYAAETASSDASEAAVPVNYYYFSYNINDTSKLVKRLCTFPRGHFSY